MAMASHTTAHPVYTGVGRSRLERFKIGRKYGKYDFERFDQLAGSSYFLGKGSIGEMEVACNFLFTKSKWGVLTPEKNPGGVVYLDLIFTEPPGCSLKGATVVLTLDEEDEDLRRHFAAGKPPPKPRVPVQITEHGPQKLHGEMRQAMKATKKYFAPQINAGTFGGFGGVGRESEQQEVKKSQWRFSSQPLPNHRGRATTLRWDLSENELDRQPGHSNKFHTAFAFEHDGQPFFMQVEVSGHLESTTSHLKHKVKQRFKRFKFPAEPRSATTMVNFGGRTNTYQTPLDELVQTLSWDMVMANMKTVPRVATMRPTNTPLYQVSAETEETTIEDVTANVAPDAIEQPYITNQLTAAESAELRAQALSVMALGHPSIEAALPLATTTPSVQSDEKDHLEAAASVHGSEHTAQVAIESITPIATELEQNTTIQRDPLPRNDAEYAGIENLLRESGLPLLIQFIILWLMSFKKQSSSLPLRQSMESSGGGF